MSFLDLEQLPFKGMSYEFVGETQCAPFSAYIVNARPGQGPPLHTHPYVEVAFTLEGRATITVGNETREVKAGGIVVIPRTHRIDLLIPATAYCARLMCTHRQSSYRQTSNERCSVTRCRD